MYQSPFDDPLGLTRVIDCISQFKKPLIVHNGMLDLMFLYDKFYTDLPESSWGFKTAINHLFPLIYDSQFIMTKRKDISGAFPSKSLSGAFERASH